MRALLPLVLIAACGQSCLGQGVGGLFSGPSCESQAPTPGCATRTCNNPRCTKCRPKICVNVPDTIKIERPCGKDIPREVTPPSQPRDAEGPQGQPGLQETGAYIAPPRTGSMRGATNVRGVDGGSITFPELRLRMPSFELPSCFKSRSGARMHIDSAVAPWESHGFVATGAGGGDAALHQRIALLEDELKKRDAQQPNTGEASDRAAVERNAAADYARKLQEYEDLLKRCEEEQQRLRDCIQNCLEQHKGRGATQKPVGNNPQQAPIQAPPPKPQPTDANSRRIPPVEFEETPASYMSETRYSEPRRLITEPRPRAPLKPIHEPQAPSAKITGFRAAR